jgi:hypothetical protein|tara:strand:+ start:953 stop:1111 length:159 start_codon:yes stop_codon:yes gene_type:complete
MADKKNFKPHMMYPKQGKGKMAKTYAEHLKFKKMGWGHTKPKVKKNGSKKKK